MAVIIIDGLPGAGKSTLATILTMEWQQHYNQTRRQPREIWSNFEMSLPNIRQFSTFDEVYKNARLSIVVIDEAGSWFSGYNERENLQFLDMFTQNRKDGNTLILIAQSFEMLGPTIRQRTCEGIWHVKRLFGPNRWEEPSLVERKLGWWSMCTKYRAKDYGKTSKQVPVMRRYIRLEKWHGMFDTLVKIGGINDGVRERGAGLSASQASAKMPTTAPQVALPRVMEGYQRLEMGGKVVWVPDGGGLVGATFDPGAELAPIAPQPIKARPLAIPSVPKETEKTSNVGRQVDSGSDLLKRDAGDLDRWAGWILPVQNDV